MSARPARPVLDAESARRVRRDERFRSALTARLPADLSWRSQGSCLRHDPELFFPNAAEDPTAALAICARCPVRAECLAAALDAGDCDGVWGGTTGEERRLMRQVWVTAVPNH